MRKLVIPGLVLAASLALTGVALAQDAVTTGPDTTACDDATALVVGFDLDGKVATQQGLADTADTEATRQQGLAATADATATAQQKVAEANDVPDATTEQRAARDTARELVTAALAARDTARDAAAQARTARDTARALVNGGLKLQLDGLTAARDTACAPPADPAADPTTSAAPTTPTDGPPLYADCAAAAAAGAAPIVVGEPGYRSGLDADGDGTACDIPTTMTTTGGGSGFSQIGTVPAAVDTGRA